MISPRKHQTTRPVAVSSAAEPDAAIHLEHLTKRFGGFTAVADLSFTVAHGEIFGLLGPNGSGKTTTVNVLCGLSKPTSGVVKVLGFDVAREPRAIRPALGAVPQETALYEELSAWANMTFHADLYGVPRAERDGRITKVLDLVQLLDRRASRVSTFSGGMKRRLALARALLHEPRLVYLDEPTLGVDVQSRRALWDYILGQKALGRTVLITTNYLEEANALCDRLAILDRGRLIALDTPDGLKRRYGSTVLELETVTAVSAPLLEDVRALPGVGEVRQDGTVLTITIRGEEQVTGRIVTLVTREAVLRAITQREPNLEEVFLRLTGSALRD